MQEGSNIQVVKLDFKITNVLEEALKIVFQMLSKNEKFELWLNADILQGPNSQKSPVNSELFLDLCLKYFLKATLSLGYTTEYNKNCSQMKYSQKQMEEMYLLLEKKKCLETCKVTFPVRAVFACK